MVGERLRRLVEDVRIAQYLRSWYDAEGYIHDDISIQGMSQEAGIHTHRMEDYFRRKIRLRVTSWRNRMRIIRAMELFLSHPLETIDSVGYDVGFCDRRNFHNCFSHITGTSPHEFKKKSLPEGRLILYRVSRKKSTDSTLKDLK